MNQREAMGARSREDVRKLRAVRGDRTRMLAGVAVKAMVLVGVLAAPTVHTMAGEVVLSLEPCINGEVSATGIFPTQAMEDQFLAYARWVERNGLPRDYALHQLARREPNDLRRFPD